MSLLVFALVLFIFQIATILVFEYRHPTKTVAWLFIMFIFPIIGFVVYYFTAKEYRHRKKLRRKPLKVMEELRRELVSDSKRRAVDAVKDRSIYQEHRLFALLKNIPASPITSCNQTDVLTNAAPAYDAMMRAIENARDHVHMEFYTIRSDEIGTEFQRLLIRKAREGVKVRLMYDGIGSYKLKASYVQELRQAGVETACFLPPLIALFDKRINYRNHRKILVTDGRVGFLGGINIGDEYLGKNPKLGFWRDTHFRLEGDAVYYLQHCFLNDWMAVTGQALNEGRYFPEHECQGKELVQIVISGPDGNWDTILEVLFAAIAAARYRVYITTPYFVPDDTILMALKTAVISGVDVRIIFPAVPDSKLVYWASQSYLDELMQTGVRFYRYQEGFIHAKVTLIDHTMAFAGTANMDMRSFFSNFEMNGVWFDRKVIDRLERDFNMDLQNSEEVDPVQFALRPRHVRVKEIAARLLSPLF